MSWKKVKFKGNDSVDRLHRIQTLCSSSDTKLDGILIAGGVDSCHSQASQAALKYLFLGSSGQELLGEQVISQEHERLEDVILFICPHRVSIFYSSESEAALTVLPVISKWRHVMEYVVHDGMELDEQEKRKISAFKSMMIGVKCVGVPFGVDQDGANLQDTMLPEKWPLVQSYGLEGGESSGKGFFTMNHRVVNISREMMHVLAQLDQFSAKRVVLESQPFLTHHFDEFLLKLDHESPDLRNSKSECDLGENLLSFYEFGTMQYSTRGLKAAPNRGSRVLFGVRTRSLTEKSSSKVFLANSGVKEGIPATHMVVQAEDPFTGVQFARTYFLSSGKICRRVVDQNALVPSLITSSHVVRTTAVDTKTMIDMYSLLLRGFKTGFPTKFIDDQLRLTAEIMDARGQPVHSLTEDWCLLYCSMKLADIPSDANPSVSLGSLVVGDTFLFHGHNSCSVSDITTKQVLHITKPFANFRSWIQSGEEAEAVDLLLRTLQSEFMVQSSSVGLGTPLNTGIEINGEDAQPNQVSTPSKATLLLNSDLLPILHGSWRVFTGGFVFSSPHFNPIIVSIERSVKSLTILPSSYEELVLLKMELKEEDHTHSTPVSESSPITLESQHLYIPLQSGTRFQDEVFRALESWKTTATSLNIPVYRTSDLSEQFDGDIPRDRELASFDVPISVKSTCELLVQKQTFVGHDVRIVDHFFPQHFIPKDSSVVTNLPKPNTEDRSRLNIPVTIMIGIPGSGVHAMSQVVCKISSANFDWTSVDVDLRDLEPFKQQKMEASGYFVISDRLTRTLNQIKSSTKKLQLPPRIMVNIVGYVDPITVTCAVRRASHDVSLPSKIGAVINCVSATNIYLPDQDAAQSPFLKVFDQMAAGFVTHTVLSNSADISAAILQRLRFRMDQVNPFADVMVLSHDVFEGPLTPLLAVDQFESAYYKQYRNVHYHDWDNAASIKNAVPMYTRYVAEIETPHAPVSFRFEIVPGMDRSKFTYLIVKTLTPFATMAKSMDRVYPMESKNTKGIRIAQTIAMEKVRQDSQVSGSSSAIPYFEDVLSNGQSRSCWCVEGQVVFKDEPGCVYDYCSSGTFARLRVNTDHLDNKTGNLPSLELKVTGQGLNAEKLRDLLLSCYAQAEVSPNQILSKASISLDEKREIQRRHAMDPLPEGYLFDGTNYVDYFGGRYEFHPCIAQFIDEYITAANDVRKAANLKASEERESQKDFVRQVV
ncbi:hypothetical protein PHMEG_00018020 [Phytophthora megakarya]|uniref:Uncharacterized protein n=1 Tax=Phytophthora megakarya TaxID=4795 RepID=A0A225VXK7_9STRA|nr:hypothetical protein PHMEG_00018020 [Phytophthora megakarya]